MKACSNSEEEFRQEVKEALKDIYRRLDALNNFTAKIEERCPGNSKQLNDLSARVEEIEKTKYKMIGIISTVGLIVSGIMAAVISWLEDAIRLKGGR